MRWSRRPARRRRPSPRCNKAIVGALNDPAVRKALTDSGVDVNSSTPEWLRAYIKSEIPKWAEVIKASGAKAE